MNKWSMRKFGDPLINKKNIIITIVIICVLVSIVYSISKVGFEFGLLFTLEKSVFDKYSSPLIFKTNPIGDSIATEYSYKGDGCHLQYIVYDFETDLDAKSMKDHSLLMGSGFLVSRKTGILSWANYSRMDVVTKGQNLQISRLVVWENDKIYNIETSCEEDLILVAEELAND